MASTGYRLARRVGALVVLAALSLSGCATLSEDECRTANWQAIGYEDGVDGQPANRVARHRKACAKHDVQLDLAAYNAGRAAGLEVYCQPHNGYREGLAGNTYHGECPAALADEFVFAYNYGREIHDVEADVRDEQRAIDRLHDDFHAIGDEILQKETLLVSPGLTPGERVAVLADIKHLVQERRDIEADMAYRERTLDMLQRQLADLRARSPY